MIRLATPADGPALAAIYDPVVEKTAISFEIAAPGAAEMQRRVEQILQFAPWLVEAEERDGQVRGYAYASRHRERAAYQWCVDVAVYVGEAHRGQGIGAALYRALFPLLRAQNFYVAHAGITLPNAASVRLHESAGFRPIGIYRGVGYKMGAWHDVGWWQLELQPRPAHPPPPKLPAQARADHG